MSDILMDEPCENVVEKSTVKAARFQQRGVYVTCVTLLFTRSFLT